MKVVLDATGVQSGSGGMTTFLTGLLSGWPRVAADDEIVLLGMPELPEVIGHADGVVREVIRAPGSGQLARIRMQQLYLPRLVRQLKPDVFLSADPGVPFRSLPCPAVATVHDLRHLARPQEFGQARRRYRGLMWGRGIRRADRIIVNSAATGAQVAEHYPAAVDRVREVRFGADHVDSWRNDAVVEGSGARPHAITFGHWTNKRPDFAIRIWGVLYREHPEINALLEVVGVPESEHAGLQAVAAQEGVEEHVRIRSFVPDDAYRQLFSSAAIVLMTSTLEGFGLPVVEAMQLGIPVVASGGVGMETAGGDAALYADAGSPESFARRIASVLTDEAERARVIAHGREHASTFNWADTAASVRAVLEEAIEARRA